MEDLDKILQERLASIHNELIENLGAKISEIKNYWGKARFGRCDSLEIERLKQIAQELANTSAPFNLFLISDRAYKLEQFLSSILNEKKLLSEIYRRQIELLIQSLETVAVNIDKTGKQPKPRRWQPVTFSPELYNKTPHIYMLDTNNNWAKSLAVFLRHKNFLVEDFDTYESLKHALTVKIPRLVITDTQLAFLEKNKQFKKNHRNFNINDLPVIYISGDDNIKTRLTAVRSGASCFFNLPVDNDRFLDSVRELTTGIPKDPFRIMVVDNDVPLSKFYAAILEQEGMDVTIVNDPKLTLEMVARNKPELILLNYNMPELSGLELTKIIRQEEDLAGIAIVFLSIETDYEKQLTAINTGGDDFISVPVEPDYLITSISSRVYRARTLNQMNAKLFTALRELENQQFALNQHAIVSITNINGTIINVNNNLCEISGYSRSELIGKDHSVLNSGLHDNKFFEDMWSTIGKGQVWQGEICNRKKNNDLYWVNCTIVPFIDEQKRPYQYVSINSDITAKKFTEQDLLKARDIAVNASQAKSDFLSKMSHELRTPLNAVLGFSQLMESSGEKLSESQLQYLREIHNAGDHLLHLINEVLDLSRIEANQLNTESINIPLSGFLDECISLILPETKNKKIRILRIYHDNDDLYVYADPLRLKQVIVNLLSNATKYNRAHGHIEISTIEKDNDKILIEIANTGEGISNDQISKLFLPFSRLPQHKKEEGVGIGLALSKRLTELMGGKIGVRSNVNELTTFWVELTRAKAESQLSIPTQDKNNKKEIKASSSPPTALLYVEDNEINLLLVKKLLENRTNIKLYHAGTVNTGIETAREHMPDIILMDLDLPDMSGFDGIQLLKESNELKHIPVLAISAYADDENIQRAFSLGFDEYITKPIDVDNFLETIDNYKRSIN